MRKTQKVPEYLIDDYISLGWETDYQTMEGNCGCFNKQLGQILVTSFAQLYEPQEGVRSEFRLVPEIAVGTPWFKEVYRKISHDLTKYPRLNVTPPKSLFTTANYTRSFLKEICDWVVNWAQNIDLNQALKDTATIPSDQCFPSNSFTYITANAILGNTLLLEDIALLIQNDEKRAIATYVKTEHVKNALNYCKSDQRADLKKHLKL